MDFFHTDRTVKDLIADLIAAAKETGNVQPLYSYGVAIEIHPSSDPDDIFEQCVKARDSYKQQSSTPFQPKFSDFHFIGLLGKALEYRAGSKDAKDVLAAYTEGHTLLGSALTAISTLNSLIYDNGMDVNSAAERFFGKVTYQYPSYKLIYLLTINTNFGQELSVWYDNHLKALKAEAE